MNRRPLGMSRVGELRVRPVPSGPVRVTSPFAAPPSGSVGDVPSSYGGRQGGSGASGYAALRHPTPRGPAGVPAQPELGERPLVDHAGTASTWAASASSTSVASRAAGSGPGGGRDGGGHAQHLHAQRPRDAGRRSPPGRRVGIRRRLMPGVTRKRHACLPSTSCRPGSGRPADGRRSRRTADRSGSTCHHGRCAAPPPRPARGTRRHATASQPEPAPDQGSGVRRRRHHGRPVRVPSSPLARSRSRSTSARAFVSADWYDATRRGTSRSTSSPLMSPMVPRPYDSSGDDTRRV